MREEIGFIGLGVMGKYMAENLLKAGFNLALYDINEAALGEFKGKTGVRIAATAADAGKNAGFENAVPLPGTALVTNLYVEAKAHGEENNGNQALYKVFERLTGRKRS